jgi:hypothetical protein
MKTGTKALAIEHVGLGIAKIVSNYSESAVLINACDVAANRYHEKIGKNETTHLSTTQNIPPMLRLDMEIEVTYSNENLVEAYRGKILNRVYESYIIASVSVVDGILEDLFEIFLRNEEIGLSEDEIERRVSSSWRNDTLLNYLTNPQGLNLQNPQHLNMSYRETFLRYYEFRILRHAIIHTDGQITDKDYARLQAYEHETPQARKQMALINSPLLDGRNVVLNLNYVLSIRQYLDRFLMYFYTSISQEK